MGSIFLITAFVLAGSSVVAAYFVSAYIPPFATTFFSLVFASLTAILLCGKRMYTIAKQLSKEIWIVIALQALFGNFLFRVFLTIGLQHIGAAEAGIITGATPAITALFAWIILRERLKIRTVMGILITVAGILLVQGFPFEITFKSFQPLGVTLVLASAACEALFTTLSRKIYTSTSGGQTLPPLVHAGLVSIFAMGLCLLPTLIESPWPALMKLPVSGWLALLWYGSIVTIVAFTCMFAGAKRCNGYTIAAFAGIIPISSTILSVTILKEQINTYQVIGCVLVVLATLVISKKDR